MDVHRITFLISTVLFVILLISNKGQAHIEYYGKAKWLSAIKTCQTSGGILVSDLEKYKRSDTVWSGRYKYYSWRVIMGCFNIENHAINYVTDIGTCQAKCKVYDFFAVKGDHCICLESIDQFEKQEYRQCDCDNCFQVFRHKLKVTNEGNHDACMTVECALDVKTLKEVSCDSYVPAICDNNKTCPGDKYQGSYTCCEENSSFIKWMYDGICAKHFTGIWWTSGARSICKTIFENEEIDTLSIVSCGKAKWKESTNSFELKDDDCDDENPFYCETSEISTDTSLVMTSTEKIVTKGTYQSTDPIRTSSQVTAGNLTISKQESTSMETQHGTIIAGIIVSVIVILVIITAVYFIRRRKGTRDQKKPIESSPYVYSNANPNQVEQRPFSVANQSYNDINDSFLKTSKGTMLSPNYDLETNAIKIKNGSVPAPSYAQVRCVNKSSTPENYDFAQPITNESDYVYNSDYDHLHKIIKTKQESDYALTCHEFQYDRNSKTYDTFASSNGSDGQQAVSDYDHLPTNIGSDPMYDCAAMQNKIPKETYYDCFSK